MPTVTIALTKAEMRRSTNGQTFTKVPILDGGVLAPKTNVNRYKYSGLIIGLIVIVLFLYLKGGKEDLNRAYDGPTKNDVVIVDSKFLDLPNGNKMHYIKGGVDMPSHPKFILIHGQSRTTQSARHWAHHYDVFDALGTYFALDLIGYGTSNPGASSTVKEAKTSIQQHSFNILRLLEQEKVDRNIVLVGRSWGSRILFETAKKLEGKLKGIVLVAPTVQDHILEELPSWLRNVPILVTWSKDDPIVPFSRSNKVLATFKNKKTVFFDKLLEPGMAKVVAHTPENMRVLAFQNALHEFVTDLELR